MGIVITGHCRKMQACRLVLTQGVLCNCLQPSLRTGAKQVNSITYAALHLASRSQGFQRAHVCLHPVASTITSMVLVHSKDASPHQCLVQGFQGVCLADCATICPFHVPGRNLDIPGQLRMSTRAPPPQVVELTPHLPDWVASWQEHAGGGMCGRPCKDDPTEPGTSGRMTIWCTTCANRLQSSLTHLTSRPVSGSGGASAASWAAARAAAGASRRASARSAANLSRARFRAILLVSEHAASAVANTCGTLLWGMLQWQRC